MVGPNYKKQLEDALERLGELAVQKGELELEIAKQRQLISALANMLPDEDQIYYRELAEAFMGKPTGLTDAIREALRTVNAWMSAREIKEYLDTRGFDFSGYTSNPLSSIHTVLKRLVGDGAATMEPSKRGVPCYRWKGTERRFADLRPLLAPSPLGPIVAKLRGKK